MYIDYYGFSGKPFQLSPDPRFFFGSRAHARALAYLHYGLNQGEGFIVITGGIGTGKTTLVKNLFQEFDSSAVVAAQLVTTQLEADELLRSVMASFGLPYEGLGKAALLKHFEDFLRNQAQRGRRVLLVVDEVQNLPARSLEELRMLSNFQAAEMPLLQSFLLGQEEFRHTLKRPDMEQLRQRVIASCHLSAFDVAETRDYIKHRLHVVGWQGHHPHFADEVYAAIYRFTQGIPRLINVFCDRLLLYGFLEELQEFSASTVEAVRKELNQDNEPDAPEKPDHGRSSYDDLRFASDREWIDSPAPSGALPLNSNRSLSPVDSTMEQRLLELESSMDVLLQHLLNGRTFN